MTFPFKKILNTCIGLLLLISILSQISGVWFGFDVLAHAHIQYVIIALVLGFISFFSAMGDRAVLLFLYAAFVMVTAILPIANLKNIPMNADIYFANTFFIVEDPSSFITVVEKYTPRIVALVESNDMHVDALAEIYGDPHVRHDQDGFSCAIFSKEKPVSAELILSSQFPICIAEYDDFVLLVVHPVAPLNQRNYMRQRVYFKEVRMLYEAYYSPEGDKMENTLPVVIVGDFNSTKFSPTFRKNFRDLTHAHAPTWSVKNPWFLPIDHALSHFELDISRAPETDSDHRGLFVEIIED